MSEVAINIENLSKKFVINTNNSLSLRGSIMGLFKANQTQEHWALKDVSIKVNKGEVVGIIGSNGAGKSTLLKIVSKITYPTSGKVTLYGKVSSLLEVGTGFHPELSGRENVFLNGSILGMKRAHIKSVFDEIVDFSGIEKFIDTPVKKYSSGMYVRLAFSVAAFLNPDILIVDEVLAVGDQSFQKKCIEKMEAVAKEGNTVLFVSHNMDLINRLCSRTVLLENGKVANYSKGENLKLSQNPMILNSNNEIYVKELAIRKSTSDLSNEFKLFESIKLSLKVESKISIKKLGIIIGIENVEGKRIFTEPSFLSNRYYDFNLGDNSLEIEIPFKTNSLYPGIYDIVIAIAENQSSSYHHARFPKALKIDSVHSEKKYNFEKYTGDHLQKVIWS